MFLYALIDDPQDVGLFEQIYQAYRSGMFQIAYGVLHEAQSAEDAVAEAFIKIAENIKKISAMTCKEQHDYIVVIIRNRAIDTYRRRHQDAVPLDFIEDLPDQKTAEEIALGELGYARIVRTIDQLHEKYRDVLKLRCLYQHSAEETGKLLGISSNTVNQRLARAKMKLLKLLGEEEAASHEK